MASATMEDSLLQSACMSAYAIMNAGTSVPTATLERLMTRLVIALFPALAMKYVYIFF